MLTSVKLQSQMILSGIVGGGVDGFIGFFEASFILLVLKAYKILILIKTVISVFSYPFDCIKKCLPISDFS